MLSWARRSLCSTLSSGSPQKLLAKQNASKLSRHQTRHKATQVAGLLYPDPVICNARQDHKATVFLLHGLGDTGHGWSDVAHLWGADLPDVKFVFPTAPTRPITLNMGMPMPGWFDLYSLDREEWQDDEEGVRNSTRFLEGLVHKEVESGIPSESIAIVGFSQGGAVALMMLRSNLKVSAVVGMSTFLSLQTESQLFSPQNKETPVLLCHGDCDPTVAYEYGELSFSALQRAGLNVGFKTYKGMGHSACQEELDDVKHFLAKHLTTP